MAMDASPLAKLPPELRNNIYEEVLLQEDAIKLTFKPAEDENVKSRVVLCTRRQNEFLALTLTCKPLRRETHDLFFALNSFEIYAPTYSVGSRSGTASIPVHRFLDGVTTLRARSAIKSITLNIGFYTPRYDKRCVLGAVKDFKRNLLTAYPCLPLKLRASLHGGTDGDFEFEIDMQCLASSVGGVLEEVKEVEQEMRDEDDDDDDDDDDDEDDEDDEIEIYERTLRLEQLDKLRDELHRCLLLQAGASSFQSPTARWQL